MRKSLAPHPATPCSFVHQIDAEVSQGSSDELRLLYSIGGNIDSLLIPDPKPSKRTNDLWRHTCFEFFISGEADNYYEFNFSPSSEWAAYKFVSYRSEMQDAVLTSAPEIEVGEAENGLNISVLLNLTGLAGLKANTVQRAGLAAVIESTGGAKSYWALKHAPGKPDFHHADCFALQMSAKVSS